MLKMAMELLAILHQSQYNKYKVQTKQAIKLT